MWNRSYKAKIYYLCKQKEFQTNLNKTENFLFGKIMEYLQNQITLKFKLKYFLK